jgi:hypothetical protein
MAAAPASATAGEPREQGREAPASIAVREIDLKGYKAEWKSGSVLKPAEIVNAEELAKAIPDKEWQAKITRQVDFAKEKLLFFVWMGSSGDRLSFVTAPGKDGQPVVFRYAENFEHMMVAPQHFRLYVIPREAIWKVEKGGKTSLHADPPAPTKAEPTAKLLKDLESDDPYVRGAAIDLLADRKAKEAISRLVELASDGAALIGSDNWVGLHAMHALTKITGQAFDLDEKKWRAWWKEQRNGVADLAVPADSAVKVLSVEAAVEVRGLLVYTPKGTFVMVRDQRPFTDGGFVKEREVVAWELDFGKKGADMEQLAKSLSGKTVVLSGKCKMASVLTFGGNPLNPLNAAMPSGSEWRLEKTVLVSSLAASEKK